MCGRFAITLPDDAMARLFDAVPSNDMSEVPRFNVCPTTQVAAVSWDGGARRLRPMRWGFLPHWYKAPADGPLLINARSETIAEKPAFRAACRERRCLIPASGFYEWTKTPEGKRLPWYITRRDGGPIVFAGIWQDWGPGGGAGAGAAQPAPTCAIVTCAANEQMAQIHHRMPVLLDPANKEGIALWLGQSGKGAARLMVPAPEPTLIAHRVDPAVNSNRASGPELISPVAL